MLSKLSRIKEREVRNNGKIGNLSTVNRKDENDEV